jgi:plastocyanin
MRYLLAATLFFAVSVPALAATQNVKVDDDFFDPAANAVALGDTVQWHWTGSNDHTVTTRGRQIDKLKSGIHGKGFKYEHLFKYAGRFRYFCEIHPDTMRATVTVGTDDGVKPKITRVRAGARKIRFRLSERSVVTLRIKGRRKIVKVLGRGKRAIRYRRLAAGSHKASLTAKDGFGHIGRRSKRFTTG